MKDAIVHKSKHLSLVLRHKPESVGLTLDSSGWVRVERLLAAMKWSMQDLEHIVADNNKKRFEFSEDKTKIRACQGHSVDVELGYEPKTPPDILYHGTSRDFLPAIVSSGLQKMKRHHVHLSSDMETASIVAKRRPRPMIFQVAASRMLEHKFYLSTNGVWLVDHVPFQYLSF